MNVGSGFTNGWQREGFIFQTRELISYLRCRTSAVSGHLLRQDVRRETYRKEIRERISRKRKKIRASFTHRRTHYSSSQNLHHRISKRKKKASFTPRKIKLSHYYISIIITKIYRSKKSIVNISDPNENEQHQTQISSSSLSISNPNFHSLKFLNFLWS
jgi:hypothetical protein